MTNRNVTVTSKNQITLPADIVRDMQLNKHRRLVIRRRGYEIVLYPQPSLEDQLSNIWKQLPTFRGTKDEAELKDTSKEAWGSKDL